jgi:peptidoglycan/xylan/chitin deacetylase (PgdA/CDA1 family)
LTFDDGPWTDTPAVLDLLAQYRIKATFCMVGRQVATHAALVQRIVAEGHTLCNHTWSHDEMLRTRAADGIAAELQRTNDAIHAVVPSAVIRYFRAPGGNFSPQIVSIAAGMGMASISWNVDPQDWRGPGVQSIITDVLANTRPGSIVLLHDGAGPQTVAALRTILPELARRYTLIALPDSDPAKTPDRHADRPAYANRWNHNALALAQDTDRPPAADEIRTLLHAAEDGLSLSS